MFGQVLLSSGSATQSGGIWQIKVKTVNLGKNYAAVPVCLYNQPGRTVYVDWGDGTHSMLVGWVGSEKFKSNSIHTYSDAGEYTISMVCENWSDVYLWGHNSSDEVYGLTNTRFILGLTTPEMVNPFPRVKGTVIDGVLTAGSFDNFFYHPETGCTFRKLPDNLFENNTETLRTAEGLFYKYMGELPKGLFKGCHKLKSVKGLTYEGQRPVYCNDMFIGCTSLTNMSNVFYQLYGNETIHIDSRIVEKATAFFDVGPIHPNLTIEVPKDSTTYTSFMNFYNSLKDGIKSDVAITTF